MAARRAGHVCVQRLRRLRIRCRWSQAAQPDRRAARGHRSRCHGTQTRPGRTGTSRAHRTCASSPDGGEQVQLGAVITPQRRGQAWLSICLGFVLAVGVACGGGSGGTASSSPSVSIPSGSSPSPSLGFDWREYHQNAARSGVGSGAPSLGIPHQAWRAAVDGDVYASPLIVAGHVVVATENNTVYSLDLFSGAVVWHRHLGDPVDASTLPCGDIGPVTGITGTPVADVVSRRLYVVAFLRGYHHVLFTLSLIDGSVVGQHDVDPPGSDPLVQQEPGSVGVALLASLGLVVAIGKEGVAYLLRAGQLGGVGGQIASRAVCAGALGGTASSGSMLWVPCSDGLVALTVTQTTISIAWKASSPRLGSPILAAGAVWAIEPESGRLYALDVTSGAVLYKADLGQARHFSTPAATEGFLVSPAGAEASACPLRAVQKITRPSGP